MLATVLALAGCTGVPTSGPVERHTPQATGVNTGVRVDPLPPVAGASQLLIVEGFLHAMSVYQPGYSVARQYLTEAASESWHPEAGVQVYTETDLPVESEQGVALSGVRIGTVDAAGVYLSTNTPLRHVFTLVKNAAGQWRISNPPEGLLVSRYLFSTNFISVNLHFMDATNTVLVPEPRYFATGEQNLDAAVRAQLGGPSSWLTPAVRAADTSGIAVDSVRADPDGLLEIRLGSGADRTSMDQRRMLLAELAFTMTGFDQVAAIRVSGGGQLWRTDYGLDRVAPQTFSALSPANESAQRTLFVIREHKIERLRDVGDWSDFDPVESGLAKPETLAVRSDLGELAATTTGGTRLEAAPMGSGKARVLRTDTGLLRPDYARNGELWSPAASGLAGLQIYRDDVPTKVELDGIPKGQVVALALSPDGARLAAVLRRPEGAQVGLVAVARTDAGVRLTGWRSLDDTLNLAASGEALDVGWMSQTDLVVLRSGGVLDVSVTQQSQDGSTTTDLGPSESSSLSSLAAVAGRLPVARADSGVVYRFDGEFNWTAALTAVDAVTYSG